MGDMIRAWSKSTIDDNGYFIGTCGDWGGPYPVDRVEESNATLDHPPIESTRDGQPCEWVDSAWVLLTSGEAFDVWAYAEYVKRRADEYPPLGDQLDALWKQHLEDRTNGKALGLETNGMLDKINAVKLKFPKPTE